MSTLEAASVYNRALAQREQYVDMAWQDALRLAEIIDYKWQSQFSIQEKVSKVISRLSFVFQDYLEHNEFNAAIYEHITLASHAMCEYLSDCLENDQPEAAQFIFPPEYNLEDVEMTLWNGTETGSADDAFAQVHTTRNQILKAEIIQRIITMPQGKGEVINISGPMFSAKSGLAKEIYHALQQYSQTISTHVFIFSGMGESSMHARKVPGDNPHAEKVDVQGFVDAKDRLINSNNSKNRNVIFIEEITFFTSDEGEANRLLDAIEELTENGFFVITIGLDNNYRGGELLIHRLMREREMCLTYKTNSILMEEVGDGSKKIITQYEPDHNASIYEQALAKCAAETTLRYDMLLGMFDFFCPIFFPREESGNLIEYRPIVSRWHPMLVLKRRTPELWDRLMKLWQNSWKEHYAKHGKRLLADVS